MKNLFCLIFVSIFVSSCNDDEKKQDTISDFNCSLSVFIDGETKELLQKHEETGVEFFQIITPNGDGNNDVFVILGIFETTNTFKVYDGGEVVFETENYGSDDNYFRGECLSQGEYKFELNIYSDDILNNYVYKGNVWLQRKIFEEGQDIDDCGVLDLNDPIFNFENKDNPLFIDEDVINCN